MNDLLKVLDMSEDEQRVEIAKYLSIKPFKHDWGFSNAVGGSDNIATGEAWVCRKCGHEEIYKRIKSGQYIPAVLDKQSPECGLPDPIHEHLADLAFRLSGGKIAGKKPIEYIIDAFLHGLIFNRCTYSKGKRR